MLSRTFSSLKHRNYRLFFYGEFISLIGTWMQWAAQQWLVYEITRSKTILGVIAACQTFPMLIFSIVGGMAADRVSKRNVLLCAQFLNTLAALALGILILMGIVEVWHVGALALATGIFSAFSMPARQSFIVELVGKEDLMNAIGLNSSIFNFARMAGPAAAGMVMASTDIGMCFILNAVSYVASIIGLALIRFPDGSLKRDRKTVWTELKDGFSYVRRSKEILWLLAIVSVIGIFGHSHTVLIPAFAKDILSVGEKGYGFMMMASGLGALLAALTVATIGKIEHKRSMIFTGIVIFSIAAGTFAYSSNYCLSVAMLMLAGYGITVFLTSANTLVQLASSDEMRGRIMGIWTFVFGGMMPLGSIQVGFVGDHWGPQNAVMAGAVICFVSMLVLGAYFWKKTSCGSYEK